MCSVSMYAKEGTVRKDMNSQWLQMAKGQAALPLVSLVQNWLTITYTCRFNITGAWKGACVCHCDHAVDSAPAPSRHHSSAARVYLRCPKAPLADVSEQDQPAQDMQRKYTCYESHSMMQWYEPLSMRTNDSVNRSLACVHPLASQTTVHGVLMHHTTKSLFRRHLAHLDVSSGTVGRPRLKQ